MTKLRGSNKTNNNKKAMMKALESCLGLVTQACKKVGISRWTHYQWLKEDEEYKKKCEAIAELVIDMAESSLYKQIHKGNPAATIFFLKTRGKNRGYQEEFQQLAPPKHEIILTLPENNTNFKKEHEE